MICMAPVQIFFMQRRLKRLAIQINFLSNQPYPLQPPFRLQYTICPESCTCELQATSQLQDKIWAGLANSQLGDHQPNFSPINLFAVCNDPMIHPLSNPISINNPCFVVLAMRMSLSIILPSYKYDSSDGKRNGTYSDSKGLATLFWEGQELSQTYKKRGNIATTPIHQPKQRKKGCC